MKIDDREVPAAIVAYCLQALGGLPGAALATVAKMHTFVQAGLRPGRVSPPWVLNSGR